MSTDAHLELILAFCRSRLALAEERTPGPWLVKQRGEHGKGIRIVYRIGERYRGEDVCGGVAEILEYQSSMEPKDQRNQANADFIAACAGAAEAGWRATIAAIGRFRQIADMAKAHPVFESFATWAEQGLENILAAYPLELLTDDLT